jgi:hypothetical protein
VGAGGCYLSSAAARARPFHSKPEAEIEGLSLSVLFPPFGEKTGEKLFFGRQKCD